MDGTVTHVGINVYVPEIGRHTHVPVAQNMSCRRIDKYSAHIVKRVCPIKEKRNTIATDTNAGSIM